MSLLKNKRTHHPRSVIRPTLGNSLGQLQSLHANPVSDKHLKRSRNGILLAKVQRSLDSAPSLLYYLWQQCGISFEESAALVGHRRIWAGGKPLQSVKALEVQVPASLIPDLNIEVVNVFGEKVSAVDRHRHRYYGFLVLGKQTVMANSDLEPRSYVHVINNNRIVPWEELQQIRGITASSSSSSSLFEYRADGLDVLAPPLLLKAPGMRSGMRGITIVTSDVSLPPSFASACGFDGEFNVLFKPGTPVEEIDNVARTIQKILAEVRVLKDAEGLVKRSVQRVLESELSASGMTKAWHELESRSLRQPERASQAPALESTARKDPVRWALRISTPLYTLPAVRTIAKLAPDLTRCVRCGPFELSKINVKPKTMRHMTPSELEVFFAFEKKMKLQRLLGGLRQCDDG